MSKWLKRAMVAILAMMCMVPSLVGCAPRAPDSETDLEISFLNVGIPQDLVDNIAAEYKKMYPEVNVIISPNPGYGQFDTTISAIDTNTIDLYITYAPNFKKVLDMGDQYLADLSPAVDNKLEGEFRTIRERLDSSYKSTYTFENNKLYTLPWQSQVHGLVYNHKWFTDNKIPVPTTTDQMLDICDDIVGLGMTPFIGNKYNYWSYVYEGWWAQYQGVNSYFDFWQAKDATGAQPSQKAWAQQGRYEALSVMEQIFEFKDPNASTGVYKYVVEGSNSTEHTDAQTKFLQGVAAMTPNASWLEAEMKQSWQEGMDFRMMRLPVISSIIEVLPEKSIKDDPQLQDVVAYVDKILDGETNPEKPDSIKDVKQADIDRVMEARKVAYTTRSMNVVVPAYAKAKDAAMDFIQVMYSDVGLKIMAESMVALPAVEFDDPKNAPDTASWSTFAQSCLKLQEDINYIYNPATYALFYKNNDATAFQTYPEFVIGATNKNDRKDALTFFKEDQNIVASKWTNWLSAAGLEE